MGIAQSRNYVAKDGPMQITLCIPNDVRIRERSEAERTPALAEIGERAREGTSSLKGRTRGRDVGSLSARKKKNGVEFIIMRAGALRHRIIHLKYKLS